MGSEPDDRPCEHEGGCSLPGRFAIGISDGAMRYWCVDHIDDGMVYFGQLVGGIRDAVGRFNSVHYRWCTDPQCPVAYVYEDKPHYHFSGSGHHPAQPPDDPGLR